MVLAPTQVTRHPRNGFSRELENCQGGRQLVNQSQAGFSSVCLHKIWLAIAGNSPPPHPAI